VDSGKPTELVSNGHTISSITVDSANVYFTDEGANEFQVSGKPFDDGSVSKVPREGGVPVPLANTQIKPSSIAVTASNIYWTIQGSEKPQSGSPDGGIAMSPLEGGTPVLLASHQDHPNHIAIDEAYAYWVVHRAPPHRVGPSISSVVKMPLAGGTPVTLASGLFDEMSLVVHAADVYWTTYGHSSSTADGALMKVAKSGGATVTVASGGGNYYGLALDASNAYWTVFDQTEEKKRLWETNDTGSVMRISLAGGAASALATRQSTMDSPIAVDSTSIYWSNRPLGFSVSTVRMGLMTMKLK
jgi:hypothetical protein